MWRVNSRFLVTEWYNPLLAEQRYRVLILLLSLSLVVQLFAFYSASRVTGYRTRFVESIALRVKESYNNDDALCQKEELFKSCLFFLARYAMYTWTDMSIYYRTNNFVTIIINLFNFLLVKNWYLYWLCFSCCRDLQGNNISVIFKTDFEDMATLHVL